MVWILFTAAPFEISVWFQFILILFSGTEKEEELMAFRSDLDATEFIQTYPFAIIFSGDDDGRFFFLENCQRIGRSRG